MINPIRLTEDHKEKLKEMARGLFPEYNTVTLEQHDADNVFVILTNMEDDFLRGGKISVGGYRFHWFELMHSASKRISENIFEDFLSSYKEGDHLIDFLYSGFKKT